MQLFKALQMIGILAAGMLTLSACNAQDNAKSDAKPSPANGAGASSSAPSAPSSASSGSGPVATVNGVPIPQSRLDLILKQRQARGEPDSPELRRQIKDNLVTAEVVAQEAAKKGVDKRPDVAAQLDLVRQQVLVNAYLQDWLKAHPISDDTMRQEYDRIKKVQGEPKEYKARHILVKTEAEAKNIINQLKKGASFDKLAKEKSLDAGSKDKGGDLGWNLPNTYVKPFSDALTSLKKGELTQQPVHTDFGWHVIRLEDARPFQFPAFEEVKPQIQQGMLGQQQEKAIMELRGTAKVEGLEPTPSPKPRPDASAAPSSAPAGGSPAGK